VLDVLQTNVTILRQDTKRRRSSSIEEEHHDAESTHTGYFIDNIEQNSRQNVSTVQAVEQNRSTGQLKIISFFKTTEQETLQEFICDTCKKCFLYRDDYLSHCNTCERHFCSVCKKMFWSKRNYEKHLVSNCPPKRYMCIRCKKTYSRKSDKDAHERRCLSL